MGILLTWFPTRFKGQIFNLGGLDLTFTLGQVETSKCIKIKKIMIFDPQSPKISLFSVGLSSYFVGILLTWFPSRFKGQIFNLGGLDLTFTLGQVETSKCIKIKKIMIFDSQSPKICLFSVGLSSYFEEIFLKYVPRRI